MALKIHLDYQMCLLTLKQKVQQSQQKASISVNSELIALYWSIGHQIVIRKQVKGWGTKVIDQLSQDLKQAFPSIKGLSRSNLRNMRTFALAWPDFEFNSIVQQAVGKIPWGHNVLLIQKLKRYEERLWYATETVRYGWSRSMLARQINNGLIRSSGGSEDNFDMILPKLNAKLAAKTLKYPNNSNFLYPNVESKESDIKNVLMKHVTAFLLEFKSGFAFVGQQYKLNTSSNNLFVDLLFYHLNLRCYVVIKLKSDKLLPKDFRQIDFSLSSVDDELKRPDDAPTIGLLLSIERHKFAAKYMVRRQTPPRNIAKYKLSEMLPSEIQAYLPSIEDIEAIIVKARVHMLWPFP